MKQTLLAVAITLASTQAFATNFDVTNPFNHVTQPQLASEAKTRSDADKALNNGLNAVNNDLQSSKAQGAAAYNQVQGQIGSLNTKTDVQQSQLNAVQNAAQIANEKGDANALRADAIEKNLSVTDDRSINNAVRLDGVEGAVRETNGTVQSVNTDLQSTKAAGVAIATSLNDKIDSVASQGAADFTKTNNNVKAVDDKVNTAVGVQSGINADQANTNTKVQGQLYSVQTSAQNAQTTADVALSIGVSNTASIAKNTTGIGKNTSDIKATNEVVTAQGNTLSEHTTQIRSNTNNIVTLNEVQQQQSVQLGSNTKQLSNHETRISNVEDYSRDMDTRLSGRLDSQQSDIRGLKRDVNKVGNIAVGALAVAGHQFSTDYQAGPQVALSGATMGGYHAVAVGFGGAVSENVFLNAAFTSAGSQTGAVVSGTYRLK